MTIELIGFAFTAVTSFIFKMYSQAQADKQEQMKWILMKGKMNETSLTNARNFQPRSYVRKFIAITFTIVFLHIMSLDGTITYIEEVIKESYFFGLIGGGTELQVKEVNGPIMTKQFVMMMHIILGFYFGKDLGKR